MHAVVTGVAVYWSITSGTQKEGIKPKGKKKFFKVTCQ